MQALDGKSGLGGCDLFISFRDETGGWTDPMNMGETINSRWQDEFPCVSPDGQYLFFNSNRPSELNETPIPDGPGNIFWVRASIIDTLRLQIAK